MMALIVRKGANMLANGDSKAWPCSTRRQNSCNASRRLDGSLPAMSAALIAPIDVPITQSGSMPASCRAW